MGITNFSAGLIANYTKPHYRHVIELGAQNMYHSDYPNAPYADGFYKSIGIDSYMCIDLNGENGAIKKNLGQPIPNFYADIVTDFGTSEHVGVDGKHDQRAFYNCWKNKFDMCLNGGIIVSENPKTGNWPEHGFNYVCREFYEQLAKKNGLVVLELGECPAMGNTTDGWNVYCVLHKTIDVPFMKFSEFKTLPFFTK